MKKVDTTNGGQIITAEKIDSDVIKISVQDTTDPNRTIAELHDSFDRSFENGVYHIVFDMGNVGFPNGSFIAMLIGKTMEARRGGGDVKILNLSETAQNHLTIFTPLTYLSIGLDEISTLDDFTAVSPSLVEEFSDFEEGKPSFIRVDAVVDSLNNVTHFVATLAQKAGIEHIELSKLKIAVYEVCMNVIEHGYHYEPDHSIGVEVLHEGNRFEVAITDTGDSFDFYDLKAYDVEEAFNQKRQGGFGLYIIQKSVDEVKYESDEKIGNRLTLIKRIK